MWFRNDLRLNDNPALHAANATGQAILCVFILEDDFDGLRPLGGAALWWLDKSLRSLTSAIEARGGRLILRRGAASKHLPALIKETGATSVYWNRRYGPSERRVDEALKSTLTAQGVGAKSFNGSLLNEPWAFTTASGGHYRVFSPFWRAVQANYRAPAPLITKPNFANLDTPSEPLESWDLHPKAPDWSSGFDIWSPGEAGAMANLDRFLERAISAYSDDRNRPDLNSGTSRLSPHLRFGEIGPAQIWRAVQTQIEGGRIDRVGAMTFLSEIAWREFSYVLLFHSDNLASENYNRSFDFMPWEGNEPALRAWANGQTGFPMVDAGMRQLWATGWMHNRVRMIVASFLTKHLLIHWRRGEDWFWDTLVDADPASNPASWQWTAGSGADAAPYFRVFNPMTQGEKFDETSSYVRTWVPELARLPRKHLYAPWQAPKAVLRDADVVLGGNYPPPIVDHTEARRRALNAYELMKERRDAA